MAFSRNLLLLGRRRRRRRHRRLPSLFLNGSNRNFATATAASLAEPESEGLRMKGVRIAGQPLYMDMQATTPVDPRVLDAMLPFYVSRYGKPHSRTHLYGWEPKLPSRLSEHRWPPLLENNPD